MQGWKKLYPGMIEWIGESEGGAIEGVDTANMTITVEALEVVDEDGESTIVFEDVSYEDLAGVEGEDEAEADADDDRDELEVDKIFRALVKLEGSDLHLKVGQPPVVRVGGELKPLNRPPIEMEEMVDLLIPMMDERNLLIFEEEGGAVAGDVAAVATGLVDGAGDGAAAAAKARPRGGVDLAPQVELVGDPLGFQHAGEAHLQPRAAAIQQDVAQGAAHVLDLGQFGHRYIPRAVSTAA